MDEVKVSVIIPVYNVEKYIEQCIKSVVNQTLKEIEIIIVNDGTKDNSIKKIEKYLSDPRIVLINKENGGLSSARNAGMKIAKGEYISFIDSDDFIELTMLEDLYNNSEKAEIVFSDIIFYDNKTKVKTYDKRKESFKKNINKGSYFVLDFLGVVWNKIYKREYLERIKLIFIEEVKIGEDIEFSLRALFLANTVKHINKFHYYYRNNREDSIVFNQDIFNKKNKKDLLSIASLEIIIKRIEIFYEEYEKKLNSYEKIELKLMGLYQYNELIKKKKESAIPREVIKNFEIILKNNWKSLSDQEKVVLKKN